MLHNQYWLRVLLFVVVAHVWVRVNPGEGFACTTCNNLHNVRGSSPHIVQHALVQASAQEVQHAAPQLLTADSNSSRLHKPLCSIVQFVVHRHRQLQ